MTGCRHDAKNTLVEELPLPRRAGRRRGAPADHGHRRRGRVPERRLRRSTTARTGRVARGRAPADASPPSRSCFAAGTLGTQKLLHRMQDDGHLPELSARLGELTRTNSEAIARRDRARQPRRRLHPGRRDHVVVPPGRAHPHRAGALRQGHQRDGPAAAPCSPTAAGRRRAAGALAAAGAGATRWRPARRLSVRALVGADDHRAGDADAATTRSPRSASATGRPARLTSPAGPRRAEPDLDPGRPRGRPPARRR